ncbi:Uncharacterised protein [Chlamydia trachomatis]|nr:Uncharacterised protein [Chlamydia trachomatis]
MPYILIMAKDQYHHHLVVPIYLIKVVIMFVDILVSMINSHTPFFQQMFAHNHIKSPNFSVDILGNI